MNDRLNEKNLTKSVAKSVEQNKKKKTTKQNQFHFVLYSHDALRRLRVYRRTRRGM